MKNLKKFSLLVVIAILLVTVTGCGNKKSNNVDGKLEDIMEKLYDGISDEDRPMMLGNIEVNEDNIEGFIGTSDIEYKEMIASESMIGSIAHSVILIRTKDGADVNSIKTKIKENIDPRKWICVWVEEDDVIIKNKGNLILVVVVENKENRDKISKNFDNL